LSYQETTLTWVPSTTVVRPASKTDEYDAPMMSVETSPLADRRVDRLDGRLGLDLDGQVDHRRRRDRDADREALHTAGQLGHDEADRLGGAGARRDEVDRRRARAPRILVRRVDQPLVAGVGVDRRHDAVADPERVVEHLGDRRQAVRRARRHRDDVVLVGVVRGLEVHAGDDRDVRVLAGRGDDHLAGPRLEVLGGAGAVTELTGRLDDDVDVQLAPRQLGRVGLREDRDDVAVDPDPVLERLDGAREAAVHGVAAQQQGHVRRRDDVVDRHPLDVGALLAGGAEHRSADPAEAVDRNSHGHGPPLSLFAALQSRARKPRSHRPFLRDAIRS
jgi:hypothetical protein